MEKDNKGVDVGVFEFYIGVCISFVLMITIVYGIIYVSLNFGKQYETICNKEVLTKINFLYTIVTEDGNILYDKNRINIAGMDGNKCTVILNDGKIGRVLNSDLNLIRNLLERGLIK